MIAVSKVSRDLAILAPDAGSPAQGESTSLGRIQGLVKNVTQRKCRSRSRHATRSRLVEKARGDHAPQCHRPTAMVCKSRGATQERMDILGSGGHQLGEQSTRRVLRFLLHLLLCSRRTAAAVRARQSRTRSSRPSPRFTHPDRALVPDSQQIRGGPVEELTTIAASCTNAMATTTISTAALTSAAAPTGWSARGSPRSPPPGAAGFTMFRSPSGTPGRARFASGARDAAGRSPGRRSRRSRPPIAL